MQPSIVSAQLPTRKSPLLISRNYALLWSGQAISGLGDAIFQTTIVLWIATSLAQGRSWAPLAVSGVFLAGQAPEPVVGPLAGVFVDRWDKRRTMLGMDAIRACLLGSLILAVAAGGLAVPALGFRLSTGVLLGAIYGTVALLTAAGQFFLPARVALVADIVPDAQREKASGLAQSSSAVTGILGPALAAPLFFAVGVGWALALDGFSFLISFAAIRLVKTPAVISGLDAIAAPERVASAGERRQALVELMDGVRLLLSTATLKVLLLVGVTISVGLGALETLSVFFLRENLHASATLFGLLGGALAAGTLLGAATGGLLAKRVGANRQLPWMAVFLGMLLLAFSRMTVFAPALAAMFLIGAVFAVLEVSETPLLLRSTPREYLGRVTALMIPMFGLSAAVSSLAAGWLASTLLHGLHASFLGLTIGPVDTIIACSGICVVGGGIYAIRNMAAMPTRKLSAPLNPAAAERPIIPR